MRKALLGFRWPLLAFSLVCLLAVTANLSQVRKRLETINPGEANSAVWVIVGTETETLRLKQQLLLYMAGQEDAESVRLRFDVLWSRIDTVLTGNVAETLESFGVSKATFNDLLTSMKAMEGDLAALPDIHVEGDTAQKLFDLLHGFTPEIRAASLKILETQAAFSSNERGELADLAGGQYLLVGILLFSVASLLAVFALDAVTSQRALTEKEDLLNEAEEAIVAKTQFISVMNHELRTPLTSIKGALGLLQAGSTIDDPEKRNRLLDLANRNCEKLLRLISDLLDVEKFSAGKMEFTFETINLSDLVKKEVDSSRSYGESYGVHLDVAVQEDIFACVDSMRIGQLMANLISNAVKFSDAGGQVRIVLEADLTSARIFVVDKGRGIPADAMPNLFKRFYQVDSSNKRERGGTGLGLSIVKSIVDAHSGTIGLNSEEGRGTTFEIRLARVADPRMQQAA